MYMAHELAGWRYVCSGYPINDIAQISKISDILKRQPLIRKVISIARLESDPFSC